MEGRTDKQKEHIIYNIFKFFSGDVVTLECVEKLIKKDWLHPLNGQKLTEKDIIVLQRVS